MTSSRTSEALEEVPPLKGIRVVELATILAGPMVGMLAAHYGAEVIKVEPPGGDPTRRWFYPGEKAPPSMSAYFSAVNAGKKSIELNLKDPEQRAFFERLVGPADVLITNQTRRTADTLGTEPARLRRINPRLVHLNITAYGEADGRKGYDALLQADTGFMDLNGPPDGPPTKMPVALIDVLTAHHAFEGLLLALLRQRRGQGGYQYLSITLQSVAVVSLMNQALNHLASGRRYVPRRMGSQHPNIVPYGEPFRTRDGRWVVLAVGSDAQYRALCRLLGDEEMLRWGADSRERLRHRERIYAALHRHLGGWRADDLLRRCKEEGIPAACVRSVNEVLADPALTPFLLQFPAYPFEGLIPSPLQGMPTVPVAPPPALNAHGALLRRLFG